MARTKSGEKIEAQIVVGGVALREWEDEDDAGGELYGARTHRNRNTTSSPKSILTTSIRLVTMRNGTDSEMGFWRKQRTAHSRTNMAGG
jgi:hypothetical protein